MNIFTALEQIGWTAFYLLVFIVVCAVLTNAIKQVIHQFYASKTTMIKLTTGEQTAAEHEQVKALNERIAASVLANKR